MSEHPKASARWLERLSQWSERHHTACVAGSLLLALAVRVSLLLGLKDTLYWDGLAPDEDTYHRWATRIADGTDVAAFAPDFPRLPARVLGALYAVVGADASYGRVLNIALGVGACALVYAIGRALYGRGAGLVAALLAACSESLAFYSTTLLHTCLGAVLTALLVWLAASCLRRPQRILLARFMAAGALAGLLINARGNASVLVLLMIPIAVAVAGARKVLLAQLLAVTVCGYLAAASVSGGLAGPRSAFNLYMGNNPDNPTPYFRPVRFASSSPEHQAKGFALEAARRSGEPLSLDGADRFWRRTVLDDALARPGAAIVRFASKLVAVVHRSPSDNNYDLRMLGELVPGLGLLLPTWLLLALGVASAPALPRDRRLAFGAAAFALYAASVALFFAGERLRAPLLVIALPFAGAGLVRLARATRAARLRCSVAFVAIALLAHAPLRGADDMSGAYNMHALLLLGRGELDESARWYRRSLALAELDSPAARIGLAAILEQQGRREEAVKVLEPVPDTHYEAATKHEWLGNLALRMRQPRAAVAAYTKAIEFDSSKRNAYQGLFIAHRMLGEDDAARAIDARLRSLRSPE